MITLIMISSHNGLESLDHTLGSKSPTRPVLRIGELRFCEMLCRTTYHHACDVGDFPQNLRKWATHAQNRDSLNGPRSLSAKLSFSWTSSRPRLIRNGRQPLSKNRLRDSSGLRGSARTSSGEVHSR